MYEISLHENYHCISIAFQYINRGNQLMIKAIKNPITKIFQYDMGFEFVVIFP